MLGLTGFQRDLLYVVAVLGAPKGVDVKAEIDGYLGDDVNFGWLYPNLDTLATMGFIAEGRKDDRTNRCRLTERGRRKIEARRAWEEEQAGALLEAAAA